MFGVERNKAEAVGDEFISENGGVGLDLDKIDGHGGNFGQHGPAQRVGKSKVDVAEGKVDMAACSLQENIELASGELKTLVVWKSSLRGRSLEVRPPRGHPLARTPS